MFTVRGCSERKQECFDVNGAVKDVLGFVGEQMKESRKERREQREEFAKNEKSFFKMFAIVFAAMLVFGLIAFVVMQFVTRRRRLYRRRNLQTMITKHGESTT